MAYNMGVGGYQNAIANGTYTTTYAQNIMATKSENRKACGKTPDLS